jgi:hypothetical protein
MKAMKQIRVLLQGPVMVLWIFLLLLPAGCGSKSGSGAGMTASETKAMSLLKQFQVAQGVYRMQSEGRYGTLRELISRNLIGDQLARACASASTPVPVNGYVFCEVESSDTSKKSGLCAYPQSGRGKTILMLLDIDDPDEWAFYTAEAGTRITAWPSHSDLETGFTRLRKYSPAEGLEKARSMVDRTKTGRR